MALTGKFLADFTDFYDACQKAVVSVTSIGEGASKVGPKLDKMVESFSGKKVIAEASLMVRAVAEIGGAAMLTEGDLKHVAATMEDAMTRMRKAALPIPAEMQKLGDSAAAALAQIQKQAAPIPGNLDKVATGAQGVSSASGIMSTALGVATGGLAAMGVQMTVGFAIDFAKDILASADALTKLSAKTGLSIEALQKFQTAGDDAGNTIEQLSSAVNAMQNKVAGGDKSAAAALEQLGIKFEAFQKLGPDEQFIAISDALRKIEDPARQVVLATDLMGKAGVEALPTLKRGFDDVKDAASGMGTSTARALDNFGDSVGSKTSWLKVQFAEAFADIVTFSTSASRRMADEWEKQIDRVAAAAPKLAVAAKVPVMGLPPNIDAMFAAQDRQREALDKSIEATKKAKKATDEYEAAERKLIDTLSGGSAMDEADKMLATIQKTIPLQQMTATTQALVNKTMSDALDAYRALGATAPQAIVDTYMATTKLVPKVLELGEALKLLPGQMQNIPLVARQTVGAVGELGPALKGIAQKLPLIGGNLVGDLGKNVLGAVMGGGSVISTVGSTIGAAMFDPEKSGIGKALTGLTSKLPGMLGKIGSMVPVIGSFIGPGIELAVKGLNKLFGKNEESEQVNPMRDKFVAAAGGIGELNKQAVAAGTSLDKLLGAKKVADFEAAVKGLQGAFEFQQQSMQVAMETAQKYGFTLEELGPAMQRQQLDQQAQQLYKDWQILNSAGLDTVAITGHMSESVSGYLQQAMALGTEVPAAMKPMLESMAKAGQLTDANGNKIEDLESAGISWSMTMTEGFKAMVESVTKLTDAISRGLGVAVDDTSKKIAAMPKTVDVAVVYHDPGFQSSQPVDVESYAKGSDGFRNFGKGTPVMLHGWEAVVPREQASSSGPALLGTSGTAAGGGAPVNIIINANGAFFDTPGDLQRLADKVNDALTAKFGLTHRMRAA